MSRGRIAESRPSWRLGHLRIAEMSWAGNFPGHTNAICANCRKLRPEITEQLDGHAVATEDE